MIEDFEDGEQVRARIQARDEQMRTYLQENFSGRTWFSLAGVDVWCGIINSTVDNVIRMMGESKKRDDNLTAQSVVFEKISDLLWNLGIDAQINYDDGFSADLSVELSPAGVARACQIYEEEGCDE